MANNRNQLMIIKDEIDRNFNPQRDIELQRRYRLFKGLSNQIFEYRKREKIKRAEMLARQRNQQNSKQNPCGEMKVCVML